ncbi:MAG TPA: hypothetical protein VIK72_06920 [Clostridiaceae bacterium]
MVDERSELNTSYGVLVPQYEEAGVRRKHISSISFFNNGNIKSISMQEQVKITTTVGVSLLNF